MDLLCNFLDTEMDDEMDVTRDTVGLWVRRPPGTRF